MNIQEKISTLVQKISVFGSTRYIDRLDLSTRELNNQFLEFDSSAISQLMLTPSELEKLEMEEKIVTPNINMQLLEVINLLMNDFTTRQAIVYNLPTGETNKFPCLSLFHFLSSDDTLDLTCFCRSSNVEKMLTLDFVYCNNLLKSVCSTIEKKPGRIKFIISSAHIY